MLTQDLEIVKPQRIQLLRAGLTQRSDLLPAVKGLRQ
jgi:hypothetical protein